MKSETENTLELAFQYATEFLRNLTSSPVAAEIDAKTLRARLGHELSQHSLPAETVIIAQAVRPGLLGSSGGRFYGWVIGGCLPAALAADWLTSTWDQNAALYACAPAAAIVEEIAGQWLKDLLKLPPTASFAFTTGCEMAHVTCLLAARNSVLANDGWNVEKRGLFGAPQIKVLTSAMLHGSIERATRMVGLGLDNLEILPADECDRLQPKALEAALRARRGFPTIVLLQAGDINIGAFDDFETLVPLAKRCRAWVHVDGAFGLWVPPALSVIICSKESS